MLKSMLYNTVHGLAEVTGYDDNGEVVDGYRIIYDSNDIPEKFIDDDGDFAAWHYHEKAKHLGNYDRKDIPMLDMRIIEEEAQRLLSSGMSNNGELYASAARNLGH